LAAQTTGNPEDREGAQHQADQRAVHRGEQQQTKIRVEPVEGVGRGDERGGQQERNGQGQGEGTGVELPQDFSERRHGLLLSAPDGGATGWCTDGSASG